jgi:hypothetical protein
MDNDSSQSSSNGDNSVFRPLVDVKDVYNNSFNEFDTPMKNANNINNLNAPSTSYIHSSYKYPIQLNSSFNNMDTIVENFNRTGIHSNYNHEQFNASFNIRDNQYNQNNNNQYNERDNQYNQNNNNQFNERENQYNTRDERYNMRDNQYIQNNNNQYNERENQFNTRDDQYNTRDERFIRENQYNTNYNQYNERDNQLNTRDERYNMRDAQYNQNNNQYNYISPDYKYEQMDYIPDPFIYGGEDGFIMPQTMCNYQTSVNTSDLMNMESYMYMSQTSNFQNDNLYAMNDKKPPTLPDILGGPVIIAPTFNHNTHINNSQIDDINTLDPSINLFNNFHF